MKHTLITLIIILFALGIHGQVLFEKSFIPGANVVESKYFNGGNWKGYHSVKTLDSHGRTVKESSFRKRKLLEKTIYQFNDHNDIIRSIVIYDINRPGKIDTTNYSYSYFSNRIVFERSILPNKDSIIFELIKNHDDTVLTYKRTLYSFFPNKNRVNQIKETYQLFYKNKLLTKREFIDGDGNKETTTFDYFPNGKLKNRKIEKFPMRDTSVVYAGAPHSDNQSYNYTYDDKGRVKRENTIIDGKSYTLVKYKYR